MINLDLFTGSRPWGKREHVRWAVIFLLAVATLPVLVVFSLYARWWWAGGRGDEGERLPLSWQVAGFFREVAAFTLTVARVLRPPAVGGENAVAAEIVLIATGAIEEATVTPLFDRMVAAGWQVARHRQPQNGSMADLAARLDALLGTFPDRRGLVLIGFGTAGLTLRYYLRRYPATGIRRVVTIATPHLGTNAPLHASASELLDETLRQLHAGDRVPQQFDVIAIASDFDAFIAPATNAYYPGAFNIQVRGMGHCALARSERLFDLLAENLAAGPYARPSMTASTRSQS